MTDPPLVTGKRKNDNPAGNSPPSKKQLDTAELEDAEMEEARTPDHMNAQTDMAEEEIMKDIENVEKALKSADKEWKEALDREAVMAEAKRRTEADNTSNNQTQVHHAKATVNTSAETTAENPEQQADTDQAADMEIETFASVARTAAPLEQPKTTAEYTPRRLMITIQIGMPKTALERIDFMAEQLNAFIEIARKCSQKQLRVIKYSDDKVIRAEDKKAWLKKFKGQGSDNLNEFTHGFYGWQALRDGAFRLKVYLAVPLRPGQAMSSFIRVLNDSWGDPQKATAMDILGQDLYNPKKIGWLFRSHRILSNTADLQNELTRYANRSYSGLKFGLNNQSIPDPNGGKWDPNTAVKAVMVEINEDRYSEAWQFLTNTYNAKNSKPPFGIHMRFVGLKDHPEFKNNPNAIHNISTLMKRQSVYLEDSITTSTSKLFSIDDNIVGTQSLRDIMMKLTPTCSGPELKDGRLFHSIARNINRAGNQEYHFTYNSSVKREAGSIVASICEFIRDELEIDPEICCYSHHVRDDHKWDTLTRTASNPDTDALAFLIEDSADLAAKGDAAKDLVEVDENETMEVSSQVARERERMLGINDTETVIDMTKKKVRVTKKAVPKNVQNDANSVISGISGNTDYSSNTQASKERKKLRSNVATQQSQIETQSKQIKKLLEALAKSNIDLEQDDNSYQESGEDSTETPEDKNQQAPSDDEGSVGVRFKPSQNTEHPADEDIEVIDDSDEEMEEDANRTDDEKADTDDDDEEDDSTTTNEDDDKEEDSDGDDEEEERERDSDTNDEIEEDYKSNSKGKRDNEDDESDEDGEEDGNKEVNDQQEKNCDEDELEVAEQYSPRKPYGQSVQGSMLDESSEDEHLPKQTPIRKSPRRHKGLTAEALDAAKSQRNALKKKLQQLNKESRTHTYQTQYTSGGDNPGCDV